MSENTQKLTFADKLAEYSDGTITLNVFPDSTLYADEMAHFCNKRNHLSVD